MFDFLLRPLKRNFGRDKQFYRAMDDMFGFIPNNIELYKLALIHKSASFVLPDGTQMNNERLEYLGDAVIEAVTSDYLYIEFPDCAEGSLTQLRSKLVSRQSLNTLALELGLDKLLAAHASVIKGQKHIYGDAFEAMMGAIYLDQGYNFVNRLLIHRIYGRYIDLGSLVEEETDFKSRLIEWCQKYHRQIFFRTKHAGNGRFVTTVYINNMEVSHGAGLSKKEAEQQAARLTPVVDAIDDETCLRLLDRIDRSAEQQPAERPVEELVIGKETYVAMEDEPDEEEPKPSPSKPANRRRRTHKRAAGSAEQPVAQPEPAEEPVPAADAAALQPEAETETAPKEKSPRPRRRRAARSGGDPKPATAESAAEPAPSEPSEPSGTAEAAPAAETPKRRPARRRRKPAAADPAEGVAEPVAAPDASPAENS